MKIPKLLLFAICLILIHNESCYASSPYSLDWRASLCARSGYLSHKTFIKQQKDLNTQSPISNTKSKNDTIRVAVTTIDGELIPWIPLPEVVIADTRIFKSSHDRAKFERLRYNVLKVMPYAIIARDKYAQLQRELAVTPNKKQQRLLVKACNEEVNAMFNREIKNLSINQGGILIKLIDREIGSSSYQILKELKGGFTAFLYQKVARVFGNSLKSTYNPEEDRDIEAIIQASDYKMQ